MQPAGVGPTTTIAGTDATRKLGHRPALDGIRALAIALVLLHHTGFAVFRGGGNGVNVFFVLSGFLITKLMVEERERTGTISVGRFYGRRAVRILPAPAVMLAIFWLGRGVMTDGAAERAYFDTELILAATYTTNLEPYFLDPLSQADGTPFGYLGHMWSLAIEEQFYLVWPVLLLLIALPRRRAGRVAASVMMGAAVIAITRLLIFESSAIDDDLASIALFSFDGFAVGAALAIALHSGAFPRLEALLVKQWVAIAGVAILIVDLVAGTYTHEIPTLYVVYTSLAAAAIIGHLYCAPAREVAAFASTPILVTIGRLSYSIYLWHNPIWIFISADRFTSTPKPVLLLAEWSLTAVVVLASYHLVEQPAMRLRKRFVAPDHPVVSRSDRSRANDAEFMQ